MTDRFFSPQRGEKPWDEMVIGILIAGIFLVIMCIYFTYSLIFTQSMPQGVIAIVIICGLVSIPLLLSSIQRIRGVIGYTIGDDSIIVQHAIGVTKIPFKEIKSVNLDHLDYFIPEGKKAGSRGEMSFIVSKNRHVKETGKLMGPYFSIREGECVLIELENSSIIALTPVESQEMNSLIDQHIKNVSGA
jgi:hypothetical protein